MAYQDEMVRSGLHTSAAQAISGSVQNGITAAGSTQATAMPLSKSVNYVSTAAASTGVVLPAGLQPGDDIVVFNGGANALAVYPPLGGTLNGGSVNAAVSVATLKPVRVIVVTALTMIAVLGA